MALVLNKPYIWIDLNETTPQIRVRLWNEDGLGISYASGYLGSTIQDDEYIIGLKLMNGADLDPDADDPSGIASMTVIPLDDAGLTEIFNPAVHSKVTILIIDDVGDYLGFQTYNCLETGYSCFQSTAPTFRPYIWMETRATNDAVVNIALEASNYYDATVVTPAEDDPESFTRSVSVQVEESLPIDPDNPTTFLPEKTEVMHLEAFLNDDTGYDPVFDRIVVGVFEETETSNLRKGGGTTLTSEGDASGDD